jgi:hypothetical protein
MDACMLDADRKTGQGERGDRCRQRGRGKEKEEIERKRQGERGDREEEAVRKRRQRGRRPGETA